MHKWNTLGTYSISLKLWKLTPYTYVWKYSKSIRYESLNRSWMNNERMDKGYYSWCLSKCVKVVAVDESPPPSCSQSLTARLTKPCDAVTLRSHTKTQTTHRRLMSSMYMYLWIRHIGLVFLQYVRWFFLNKSCLNKKQIHLNLVRIQAFKWFYAGMQ